MPFSLKEALRLLFSVCLIANARAQTVETVVPGTQPFNDGLALDAQGNVYASWYYGTVVSRITPDGVVSEFADSLDWPNGISFDHEGFLLVPNAHGNTVMRVSPEGNNSLLVESISGPSGVLELDDGSLLIAQYSQHKISKRLPDGTLIDWMVGPPASSPVGLQKDAEGNVYIGNFDNGTIIKVLPDGNVSTIADIPGWLGFIALGGDYIYATAFQRQKIYRVALDGSGAEVWAGSGTQGQADGPIETATFSSPNGIVASATGDTLYISDYAPRSLRRITGVNSQTWLPAPEATPRGMLLQPSFPNPFNPSTVIPFRLERDGRVSLSVYNLLGQRVRRLVDGPLPAGEHQVTFDAAGLAGGVYMVGLEQAGERQTRSVVLLP